jgi:hypothetical protein
MSTTLSSHIADVHVISAHPFNHLQKHHMCCYHSNESNQCLLLPFVSMKKAQLHTVVWHHIVSFMSHSLLLDHVWISFS